MPEDWLAGLTLPDVQEFLLQHQHEDPFSLSLKYRAIAGVDFKVIARQLSARKKAKAKLPEWYETPGIIFPPPENLEQASSQATAKYKASLFTGDRLIDLTGGTGIDTYYLSGRFNHTMYVEPDHLLCELARHNFNILHRPIEVINTDALSILSDHSSASHFFVDPSRRDDSRNRVYDIHDCTPDVTELVRMLPANAKLLIKLSPMLDVQQTCRDLNDRIEEIHIVALRNEVKELLFIYGKPTADPMIFTVDILKDGSYQHFKFQRQDETRAEVPLSTCQTFLYEANAAVRKSGAFKLVAKRFGLRKLGLHTHLYTSAEFKPDFPGRSFRVEWNLPYQPDKLQQHTKLKKANIQARNFPEDVAQIRRKTRLKEGGDQYLFFYRDYEEKLHVAGGIKAT